MGHQEQPPSVLACSAESIQPVGLALPLGSLFHLSCYVVYVASITGCSWLKCQLCKKPVGVLLTHFPVLSAL